MVITTFDIISWVIIGNCIIGCIFACINWKRIDEVRLELYEKFRNELVGESLGMIKLLTAYHFILALVVYIIEAPIYFAFITPIKKLLEKTKRKKRRRKRIRK